METRGIEGAPSPETTAGNGAQLVELEGGDCIVSPGAWHDQAVSQIRLDDPSMLRAVTCCKILRHLGEVLSHRPAKSDYYGWSRQVEKVNVFISHSWTTPRWSKLLVLLLHFNLWPAMAMATLVALLCCGLVAKGMLPHVMAQDLSGDFEIPRSVACAPMGMLAFWASLFALHELERCCGPLAERFARSAFLDKICIHQTDLERKQKAVQGLAAFLANSDDMLVCYSDLYLCRLWTIYEVATWLIVQPGKGMIVRPCSGPKMLLWGQLMNCVYCGATVFFVLMGWFASHPASYFPITVLCGIPIFACLAWYEGRWAEEESRIKDVVENFSLDKAQCAVEEDRPVIKSNIVAFMKYAKLSKPDEEDEEVVKGFEGLVHQKVPQLLKNPFGRAGVPYLWTLVPVLPLFLWCIDQLADFVMQNQVPRVAILYLITFSVGVFAWAPSAFALTLKIMRHPCMRGFSGCAFVGTVLSLFSSIFLALTTHLPHYAGESHVGLGALVLMWGITIAAALSIYRH